MDSVKGVGSEVWVCTYVEEYTHSLVLNFLSTVDCHSVTSMHTIELYGASYSHSMLSHNATYEVLAWYGSVCTHCMHKGASLCRWETPHSDDVTGMESV